MLLLSGAAHWAAGRQLRSLSGRPRQLASRAPDGPGFVA